MSDTRLKADQKLAARYSSANGPALQLSGDFDMKLAAWADGKYNNRPQGSGIRNLNTLAIGVFKACGLEPSIAYASQNGKTWSAPDDFPKEFAEYAKRSYNAADAGKHRGFHAEMMIIRYLLKEGYISWKSGDKDKATGSIAEVGCQDRITNCLYRKALLLQLLGLVEGTWHSTLPDQVQLGERGLDPSTHWSSVPRHQ